MAKKIYIIAGEASGDLHGANLITHLRLESGSPLEIYGVGGEKIRQTGAKNFFDLAHFHVTGLTEAIRRFPKYREASRVILEGIQKTSPDLVVLIDNPGFNLHLAKKVHALGIPIVYYIAPQVWAWAPKRILKIKKYVKKVLVVFEFEKKIYESNKIAVSWAGHPLKDLIPSSVEREKVKTKMGIAQGAPLICLLPGSRKGELKNLSSPFLKAAALIKKKIPDAFFALIKSDTLPKSFYERILRDSPVAVNLVEEDSYSVIGASELAIVCSGTATLECALLETPMVIANRGSFLTYLTAKSLIRVPYLGLPNLVLGKKKIPELLQYDVTPEKIAREALKILLDEKVKNLMRKDLSEVSKQLGEPGANRRAALEVLKVLADCYSTGK